MKQERTNLLTHYIAYDVLRMASHLGRYQDILAIIELPGAGEGK